MFTGVSYADCGCCAEMTRLGTLLITYCTAELEVADGVQEVLLLVLYDRVLPVAENAMPLLVDVDVDVSGPDVDVLLDGQVAWYMMGMAVRWWCAVLLLAASM